MRSVLLALGVVLPLSLLLRWGGAAIPLERDEGGYAYIAQRWSLGELPYKSAFDQKFPGIYLAYRLLGENIHWGAGVYSLGTLTLLLFLGRRLYSLETGAIAAAVCAFLIVDPSIAGQSSNTEVFMLLPLVAALQAALQESPSWAFAAGVLSGAVILFKQTGITNLILLFFVLRKNRRLLAAGAAVPIAAVFLYFTAGGAWKEFFDCTIGYNLSYAERASWAAYPVRFWATFSKTLAPFWPIYLFAAWGAVGGRSLPKAWLAFSFLGVAAGGRFRNHYYIQAAPALALLAAAGIAKLGRARKALPAFAALGVLLNGVLVSAWYYGPGSAESKCRRIYGYNPFPESPEVARYIADHSSPDDSIFIFGSEPQILYYAKRRSASRYIYAYPLFTPFPGTRERQRQAMAEVRAAGPKFIVTAAANADFLAGPGSPLDIYTELKELLSQSYRVVASVGIGPDGRARLMGSDSPPPKSLTVWERVRMSS